MKSTNICFLLLACVVAIYADTIQLEGLIRDVWPCTAISNSYSCGSRANPRVTCDPNKCHPDFEWKINNDKGLISSNIGADRKPVLKSGNSYPTATIHSPTSFFSWFHDVNGTNIPIPLTLTLDNTVTPNPNVYAYVNPAFWPINGKGFGDYYTEKNFHFTFELHNVFTYHGDEVFKFTGDDDLWVFINDKLVIDLGGVHGALDATVELKDLGLTVGNTYNFDIFFAERHTTQSNFRVHTSIQLFCPIRDRCGVCQGDGTSCPCTCADTDKCTIDTCHPYTGTCIYTPKNCTDTNKCTAERCDAATGNCIYPTITCDDGDACTTDSCNPTTGCSNIRKVCDDGNACTDNLCSRVEGCTYPPTNCDDNDPCTSDSCDSSSGCQHNAINCDDGNKCTLDGCDHTPGTGGCTHVDIVCNDNNPCTIDSCDRLKGCQHTNMNCDDLDVCTADSCQGGICVNGPRDPCDDGDACTTDSCDRVKGCIHTPIVCNDQNFCTTDTCSKTLGCQYTNVTDCNRCQGKPPCDMSNLCIPQECDPDDGLCKERPVQCDDNNGCTVDSCQAGECVHELVTCDQSNKCAPQTCISTNNVGECVSQNVTCDDGNKCTNDYCDPETGTCVFDPVDCPFTNKCKPQSCDPENGRCTEHPITCDDKQKCTSDSCDPESGQCIFVAKKCTGTGCSPETCDPETGECVGKQVSCDDRNKCTFDSCVNDGLDFTCAHKPMTCNDNNKCTIDSCDPDRGCRFTPVNATAFCDDGDACTLDICDRTKGCLHIKTNYTGPQRNCSTPYCDRRAGWLAVDVTCRPADRCQCVESLGGCRCDQRSVAERSSTTALGSGVIASVVVAGAAGIVFVAVSGKKSYDYWKQVHDNKNPMVASNPLYEEKGGFNENPLFEDDGNTELP